MSDPEPPRRSEVECVVSTLAASGHVDAATVRRLVKSTVALLAARAPGRSVELRIPPYVAVQVIPGVVHRRGTPPALVECDPATWLSLAAGLVTWEEAVSSARLHASGERSDLSPYLPLVVD